MQALGPTGVSGVSPRHKRPGSGCPLRCLVPLVPGWGIHLKSPALHRLPSSSSPLHPRGVHPGAGGWVAEYRIRLETRAEERQSTRPGLPARPPAPVPGLPRCGHDPLPSRARSLGRAARGSAWRPRGARRRRVPSPWRPEEAAVCAARRTKRGAPLPAIVRPRPPAERAGDPGAGRETPSRRQPRPDPTPATHKGPRLRGFPPPRGPPWMLGAGGPAGDNPPHLDCGTPAPPSPAGASICCDRHPPLHKANYWA